jgi:hypothetical protein
MLERFSKTLVGGNWYIQFGDARPQTVIGWAKSHHREAAKLAPPETTGKKQP